MKTKTDKPALIPRLRFPEFQNSGEWEVKRLGEVFKLQDGYSFSSKELSHKANDDESYQVVRITEINNKNKNEDKVYISYETVKKNNLECFKITKGDLLLSLTGAAGFNFFIWNDNKEAFLNQRTLKLVPKEENNNSIKYLVEPLLFKKINSFGTGQNNNLSKSILENLKLPLPPLPEQQKIADCLSSLDALITAGRQKLQALKDHKKGLLQNLFPREGETLPKLRFPEFQNSGEWEVKRLEDFGYFIRGLTYSSKDVSDDGLLVIRAGNIKNQNLVLDDDLVFVNKKIHKELYLKAGDIVICMSSGSRSLVGKNAEYVGNYPTDLTVGAFCSIFRTDNRLMKYIFQTRAYEKFISLSIGEGNIKNLSDTDLELYEFFVPEIPAEQQKIAACLSSLDDLINAQTQKIELLELHKKGLLQGLFPQLSEL
ncbi:MAG: type I site-specific deoxyribonuclease specificity subunit [Cyclobacteriaceae bacterium]|nr:MAG: type I site-specific deoxyribonuclease specificity subunit [Cyclobacteriaceae bacterium]